MKDTDRRHHLQPPAHVHDGDAARHSPKGPAAEYGLSDGPIMWKWAVALLGDRLTGLYTQPMLADDTVLHVLSTQADHRNLRA